MCEGNKGEGDSPSVWDLKCKRSDLFPKSFTDRNGISSTPVTEGIILESLNREHTFCVSCSSLLVLHRAQHLETLRSRMCGSAISIYPFSHSLCREHN